MTEGLYVGRIGGLAAALGVGVVVFFAGCAVASADSASGAESSSSATSNAGASESPSGAAGSAHPAPASSADRSTPASASTGTGTTSSTTASAASTASADTDSTNTGTTSTPASVPTPGVVVSTGGAHTGTYSTSQSKDPDGAATPPKNSAPKDQASKDQASESHSPSASSGSTISAADRAQTDDPPTTLTGSATTAKSAVATSTSDSPAGGEPSTPDSPITWTAAATARKESLVPAATSSVASGVAAATPVSAPVVAVLQTPPLAWLQQLPILGPVFFTPVVAAIHQIPIVGDIIHPFVGYPVQPGAPGDPVARDVMLTSFDGTQIYVHFMPASGLGSGQRATTILQGPGLGMPGGTGLNGTFLDGVLTDNLGAVGVGALRAAGYNVVTWDPRGEYRSGGVLELDSPDFEARDTSSIISWVATQPEVTLDGPGDPRMGMVGASYGGGIQLVTAATDHRVDAIVPTIAWNSLNTSLYKSDAFKSGWGTLLTAALLLTNARPNPAIYPAAIYGDLTGTLTQQQQDLLSQRGPDTVLDAIVAPTLFIQGTVDTLFSLQEAQDNAEALMARNVPTKMLWFCGGHGVCTNNLFDPTDGQVITNETLAWLSRYVKGQDTSTGAPFEWVDQRGQYFSSSTFPARAGQPIVAASDQPGALPLLPVLGGSGPLLFVLPIGGTRAFNAYDLAVPAVTATTYVVGAPQLTMTYSGTGTSRHVYAQLVDDATGAVLGNQVTPVPVTLDGQSHDITIPLEEVAHTLRPGQSLTLQIVASAVNYQSLSSFGVLNVSKVAVSLPTITDAVPLDTSPVTLPV